MNTAQPHSSPTPKQTLFSCGLELADLVVAPNLVHCSWEAIRNLSDEDNSSCGGDLNKPTKKIKTTPSSLFYVTYRIDHQPNYTVIAFACSSSPSSTKHPQHGSYQPGGEVAGVLSSTLQEQDDGLPFNFLRTQDNSFISINEEAITLFVSLFNSLSLLSQQQLLENNEDDNLIAAMERWETRNQLNHKKRISEADKKLNEMKINMAQLEWYKKFSSKKDIGYYDCYKKMQNPWDMNVIKYKKKLTIYWEDMVKEAERKPQKQGVSFLMRWLYGGTSCRRMVEPLDIADYYKRGNKDYRTKGRSNHYIMLEKWQKEGEEEEKRTAGHLNNENTRNKATSLTEDSCFWADVEEAIILTNSLQNGEESSREKLKNFESYVMSLIKNYAVSPEIFLQKSSFMQWWSEYEMVVENSMLEDVYNSELIVYMKNQSYRQYA